MVTDLRVARVGSGETATRHTCLHGLTNKGAMVPHFHGGPSCETKEGSGKAFLLNR